MAKTSSGFKIVLICILLTLTGAGGYYWYTENLQTKQQVQSIKIRQGRIESLITAQGKLEPKEYVDVGLQVSGQIKKLHVQVSDTVEKGKLMAEIDPRIYESKVLQDKAQIRSYQAQIQAQQATLTLAETQKARIQGLYNAKATSKDALDQAIATHKEAQAKLGVLQAQLAQIESQLEGDLTNLGFTKIYAPMSGIVASLPLREGQTLNSVQSAPTLAQIANLDVMTVRSQVAEADISRITVDMPVAFTTLGGAGQKWKGKIRLIQPSPEVINDVVLYNVLIDVDNPDHKLMSGMSTQVFFEEALADNVPIIPLKALGKPVPDQNKDTAKAYEVKTPTGTKTVWIGLTDRVQGQVVEGLAVGDEVLPPASAPSTAETKRTPSGGGGMRGPRL